MGAIAGTEVANGNVDVSRSHGFLPLPEALLAHIVVASPAPLDKPIL
jgi:hypothetical protein